jgi:hypothetical protein
VPITLRTGAVVKEQKYLVTEFWQCRLDELWCPYGGEAMFGIPIVRKLFVFSRPALADWLARYTEQGKWQRLTPIK